MIKKIHLKNWFVYPDQIIELSDGINAFTGPSRSGKSTIRRAVEWVLRNRPLGNSYVSYWNRDKKNGPVDDTSVTIDFFEEKSVKRYKSKDGNGYDNATTTDKEVPEYVAALFNFSDVNLQKQFDMPFMLSESASEVAKFFNKTIDLDIIDTVLGKAENERRSTNREIEKTKKDIELYDTQISELDWIDAVQEKIQYAEQWKENLDNKVEEANELLSCIENIEESEKVLKTFPDNIDQVEKLLHKALELDEHIEYVLLETRHNLFGVIEAINKYNEEEYADIDIDKLLALLTEAQRLSDNIKVKQDNRKNLDTLLDRASEICGILDDLEIEIENTEKDMPESCPTCGQIIRNVG